MELLVATVDQREYDAGYDKRLRFDELRLFGPVAVRITTNRRRPYAIELQGLVVEVSPKHPLVEVPVRRMCINYRSRQGVWPNRWMYFDPNNVLRQLRGSTSGYVVRP